MVYEHPGAVEGDGKLFHGDLDRPLGRGHRVGYGKLFPGKIVVQGQSPGIGQRGHRRRDQPGADDLARAQAVQHFGQGKAPL